MNDSQSVMVVDNDEGVRNSLGMLLESVNMPHRLYASAADLLAELEDLPRGCLVLDIRMPGMSGLQLQNELRKLNFALPIIFISGHGDIAMAVRAMRHGAIDFLSKPYSEQTLLNSIQSALSYEADTQQLLYDRADLLGRIKTLSNREHQVFDLVADGLSNKHVARKLGLSERTVECHRSQVIKKMKAHSLAELVRMRLDAERPLYQPVLHQEPNIKLASTSV